MLKAMQSDHEKEMIELGEKYLRLVLSQYIRLGENRSWYEMTQLIEDAEKFYPNHKITVGMRKEYEELLTQFRKG